MTNEELILSCAFRYAIGRTTYITGVVSDEIMKHKKDNLSSKFKSNIIREIKEYKENGQLGHDCDNNCWLKVLRHLE